MKKKVLCILLAIALMAFNQKPALAVETMVNYTDMPQLVGSALKPNIMIAQDNSGSMNFIAFNGPFLPATNNYTGYFATGSSCKYNYDSVNQQFVLSSTGGGTWDGGFLNWATMREIDLSKMVLIGGKTAGRSTLATNTTNTLLGENTGNPSGSSWPVLSTYIGAYPGPGLNNTRGYAGRTTSTALAAGSGATLNITVTSGAVTAVTVNAKGASYQAGDWLYINGAGNTTNNSTSAVVQIASLSSGGAGTVNIVYAGTGYTNGATNAVPTTAISLSSQGGVMAVGGTGFTPYAGLINVWLGSYNWDNSASNTPDIPYLEVQQGTATTKYVIKVVKDSTNACDSGSFLLDPITGGNNVGGLLQQVGTNARFGFMHFDHSSAFGTVLNPITGPGYTSTFITNIESYWADTGTPLAEMLYTAVGYFSQNQMSSYFLSSGSMKNKSTDFSVYKGLTPPTGDPFYYAEAASYVPCSKNYVIIITDGVANADSGLPASLTNFDAYTETLVPDSGAGLYLDDVALWAHTTDLRPDLTGSQTLTVYGVYVFGADPTGKQPLQQAARNGGFTDSNSNKMPDLKSEWASLGRSYTYTGTGPYYDVNNTVCPGNVCPVPDTYFEATDAVTLDHELRSAVNDIMKRTASASAVSVLATSTTGAGYMYQAFFLPAKSIFDSGGARTLNWLGDMMQLNVDSTGALRDKNNTCVIFSYDTTTNQTLVNNLSLNANGTCGSAVTASTPLLIFSNYNWNAANNLLTQTPTARNIITFADANQNGVADAGEQISFTTGNASTLQQYLNAATPTEAQNIISWVQGNSVTGYRDRTLSATAPTQQYKLGDIVHSTPTVVGAPLEAYGLIYHDYSYTSFYNSQANRADIIYTGANDGMLHAFDNKGNEIWAYIPYNLLPHLKWLADPNYTHVDYVDMKMKVTDVNFGTSVSPNWKTVLVGGMRFGGGQITNATYCGAAVGCLRNFISGYFAIDITTPTSPVVLWETNYSQTGTSLGFAMSYPAIVKVGDNFFAVVGSGPKSSYVPAYDGSVTQAGSIFAINIKTGAIAKTWTVGDTQSYFSDAIAVDMTLSSTKPVKSGGGTTGTASYNTDAVYIGENYFTPSTSTWSSRMWRLVTNNDINPNSWSLGILYNNATGQPESAAPAATTDSAGNLWVFFGTGKYLSAADATDTYTQSLYGIKDPCWTSTTQVWNSTCLIASSISPSVTSTQLANVTGTNVYSTGVVNGGSTGQTNFTSLQALIVGKSGWYLNLTSSATSVTEKSLSKPSVFGGLVMFTSFIPSSDLCGQGGSSYVYALYYLTGTAFTTPVIGTGASNLVLARTANSTPGVSSAITIHSGRESGNTALIQMSTGETISVAVQPAISLKSSAITWREL
jgi:Tfp pilus tip-associated adhesin PilY1